MNMGSTRGGYLISFEFSHLSIYIYKSMPHVMQWVVGMWERGDVANKEISVPVNLN